MQKIAEDVDLILQKLIEDSGRVERLSQTLWEIIGYLRYKLGQRNYVCRMIKYFLLIFALLTINTGTLKAEDAMKVTVNSFGYLGIFPMLKGRAEYDYKNRGNILPEKYTIVFSNIKIEIGDNIENQIIYADYEIKEIIK